MGLQGMIDDMIEACDFSLSETLPADFHALADGNVRDLARVITALEDGVLDDARRDELHALAHRRGMVPGARRNRHRRRRQVVADRRTGTPFPTVFGRT